MTYQPKHMRLSAESSDGTLSEETLSKALDQTFDEPPVVDTIVVPETFHQPIEDEVFEQIVRNSKRPLLKRITLRQITALCQTATSTQVILIVKRLLLMKKMRLSRKI